MKPGTTQAVWNRSTFWRVLEEIVEDESRPGGRWDEMTIDDVLGEVMRRSRGNFDPKWVRAELERIES